MSSYSTLTPFSITTHSRFKWPFLEKFFYRHAKTCEQNWLVVSASMSNRWKRKHAQFKNLESAREAKRCDVTMDAEQELAVLSTDTTEQHGFIPSAPRELVEGGEVSEGIFGERSELRNVVDGSSSDDCGNGDGNGDQELQIS